MVVSQIAQIERTSWLHSTLEDQMPSIGHSAVTWISTISWGNNILIPSFLRSSITYELLDLLLTLFEERYLLASLFLFLWYKCWQFPIWASCWTPRQIQECKNDLHQILDLEACILIPRKPEDLNGITFRPGRGNATQLSFWYRCVVWGVEHRKGLWTDHCWIWNLNWIY